MTARDLNQAAQAIGQFLAILNPTMSNEAGMNTPRRYTNAFAELMGYNDDPWEFTTFESTSNQMVTVKDIEFVSLCEHHLLPFLGKASVAYIPQGKVAGLSKLARTVKSHSRGLWTQEALTDTIADYLVEKLEPTRGVAVVMEATHTCMTVRGVCANGSKTITSSMHGAFLEPTNTARAEFLSLIK
jgi:GTP cyclohydrolase IA